MLKVLCDGNENSLCSIYTRFRRFSLGGRHAWDCRPRKTSKVTLIWSASFVLWRFKGLKILSRVQTIDHGVDVIFFFPRVNTHCLGNFFILENDKSRGFLVLNVWAKCELFWRQDENLQKIYVPPCSVCFSADFKYRACKTWCKNQAFQSSKTIGCHLNQGVSYIVNCGKVKDWD